MLRPFLWFVIALPLAAFLIAISVANRQPVRLALDPFKPDAPVLFLQLPFYSYLLGALILGVLIGGAAVWLGQGAWRRTARLKAQDAMRWQAEADRLTRERDASVAGARPLIAGVTQR